MGSTRSMKEQFLIWSPTVGLDEMKQHLGESIGELHSFFSEITQRETQVWIGTQGGEGVLWLCAQLRVCIGWEGRPTKRRFGYLDCLPIHPPPTMQPPQSRLDVLAVILGMLGLAELIITIITAESPMVPVYVTVGCLVVSIVLVTFMRSRMA